MDRILVVEDDDSLRECLAELLRDKGYKPDTAANGRDALALLRERGEEYSLIILDVLMPVMNGPELLRIMIKEHLDIPTMIISGAQKPMNQHMPWLTKPFEVHELEKLVETCLQRRRRKP